jgi:hypothetical protein
MVGHHVGRPRRSVDIFRDIDVPYLNFAPQRGSGRGSVIPMLQLHVPPALSTPHPELAYLLIATICLLLAMHFLRIALVPVAPLIRAVAAAAWSPSPFAQRSPSCWPTPATSRRCARAE